MLEGGGEPRAPDVQAGGERKKKKVVVIDHGFQGLGYKLSFSEIVLETFGRMKDPHDPTTADVFLTPFPFQILS